MHVVIIDQHSGETLKSELFPDNAPMCARTAAQAFCDRDWCGEVGLAPDTGYVPSSCGDIRVEFRPDPDNAAVIWSGESFYVSASDDAA